MAAVEKYTAKLYRWFRRFVLLDNDSFIVRTLIEPFISFLSSRKQMKLFPSDFWSTRLRFLLQWHEPETVGVCKQLIRPGMTVIDVGAHVGYYTRIFSELAEEKGTILAFEPHPPTFNLLSSNVPGSRYSNVRLFPLALSDKEETLEFFEVRGSGKHSFYNVSSLAVRDPEGYALQKKWQVQTKTLDGVLEELGNPMVDFLKIDVEGAEPKVLRGAEDTIRRSENMRLIIEFNIGALALAGTKPEEFLEQLKDLGFRKILALDEVDHKLKPLEELWDRAEKGYVDLLCSKK